MFSIHEMPVSERPRERLLAQGADALTIAELIAVILGSGSKSKPVLMLAQEIVAHYGTLKKLADASVEELQQIKGLGQAKAIQLKAAVCLGQRLAKEPQVPKYRIDNPAFAYHLIREELQNEKRELFVVILLDTKCALICREVVAIGTLSRTLVHPREVFYPAIRHKAASMILAHNHPSGDSTPSAEDFAVTKCLIDSGKIIGIPINDHIIIGDRGFISLRQREECHTYWNAAV